MQSLGNAAQVSRARACARAARPGACPGCSHAEQDQGRRSASGLQTVGSCTPAALAPRHAMGCYLLVQLAHSLSLISDMRHTCHVGLAALQVESKLAVPQLGCCAGLRDAQGDANAQVCMNALHRVSYTSLARAISDAWCCTACPAQQLHSQPQCSDGIIVSVFGPSQASGHRPSCRHHCGADVAACAGPASAAAA